MDTPVLLLIFNRADTVRELIQSLSLVRPKILYIAADGPRSFIPSDKEKCEATRTAAQNISWPCTVKTLFSETNQTVHPAVESAISWFFSHENEGIILEDDCMPSPDFFLFASEMLHRYRNDEQVMMISGNNFQAGQVRGDGSYYFSRYANIWGWATWKRAWNLYDTTLTGLPHFIENKKITSTTLNIQEQRYWLRYFSSLANGKRSAWDAKWTFTIWEHGGLSVTPNVNLVENIGFDNDATNTAGDTSLRIPAQHFPPPYHTPSVQKACEDADQYLFNTVYKVTVVKRIRYVFKKILWARIQV